MGRKLARRLEVGFADTDALIEQREGASVAEIYELAGADYFRKAERAVLDELIASGRAAVISTGGGLPVWSDNMARMNAAGTTVYLRRPVEQIVRRMSPYGRQKRPRLRGLSDDELLEFMRRDTADREPFYSQARWTIDCAGKRDAELIEWIMQNC